MEEELYQAGWQGFLASVRSYNPVRGEFLTYATHYIDGEMKSHFIKYREDIENGVSRYTMLLAEIFTLNNKSSSPVPSPAAQPQRRDTAAQPQYPRQRINQAAVSKTPQQLRRRDGNQRGNPFQNIYTQHT